jgi:Uma2 family endonuclease
MPPSDVRLLVEIADTTLKYDTTTKAPLYAHLGVQDYWVISAVTLETRVHREPSAKGYGRMAKFAPDSILSPLLLPELSLKLGDFEFGQGN